MATVSQGLGEHGCLSREHCNPGFYHGDAYDRVDGGARATRNEVILVPPDHALHLPLPRPAFAFLAVRHGTGASLIRKNFASGSGP